MTKEGFSEGLVALLSPLVSQFSMSVLETRDLGTFDDALVVLGGRGIRIRVVRDKKQLFFDIGSTTDPVIWFDSTLISEFLGDSDLSPPMDDEGGRVRWFVGFLARHFDALRSRFNGNEYDETRRALERIERATSRKRFGV